MAQKPTANYLEDLIIQRGNLVTALQNKGQSAGTSEHLNTLIPKINNINQRTGIAYGETTSTVDSETFEILNIPFNPVKLGISCKALLNDTLFGNNVIYIALLSTSLVTPVPAIFEVDDPSLTGLGPSDINIQPSITVTETSTGIYKVNIDFTSVNSKLIKKYKFKSNYEYTWVVSGEEWFV